LRARSRSPTARSLPRLKQSHVGVAFAPPDNARTIQVGPQRYTFIWRQSYTSWEDFMEEAGAAWLLYRSAARWLSQGDIFAKVPVVRTGLADSQPRVVLEPAPAMLISHACSLDKKRGGKSRLEYLTFLPVHHVRLLPKDRQDLLRRTSVAADRRPYEVMYLGTITSLGESYFSLAEPYTLPALLLRTGLKKFTAAETGEAADERVVPTMHDTRVEMHR